MEMAGRWAENDRMGLISEFLSLDLQNIAFEVNFPFLHSYNQLYVIETIMYSPDRWHLQSSI